MFLETQRHDSSGGHTYFRFVICTAILHYRRRRGRHRRRRSSLSWCLNTVGSCNCDWYYHSWYSTIVSLPSSEPVRHAHSERATCPCMWDVCVLSRNLRRLHRRGLRSRHCDRFARFSLSDFGDKGRVKCFWFGEQGLRLRVDRLRP